MLDVYLNGFKLLEITKNLQKSTVKIKDSLSTVKIQRPLQILLMTSEELVQIFYRSRCIKQFTESLRFSGNSPSPRRNIYTIKFLWPA